MNTDERRSELDKLSEEIIGLCYVVSNQLGCGFLEKVYENAWALELRLRGYRVIQQAPMQVWYRGQVVGEYLADLVVNESIIIELKCVKAFDDIMIAQCMNYLRGTGLSVCLLINFAKPRVELKRIVDNF